MAVAKRLIVRKIEIDAGWIEKYAHLFGYTQARDGFWVPKSYLATYENGARSFTRRETKHA